MMSNEVWAAIAGAGLGFVGSQIIEVYRVSKESKIRQRERLIEKRITAHELVIGLGQDMIAMRPVNAVSDEGFARGPWILESIQSFENFYAKFIDIHSKSSTWLWIETKRELNFCQDYFLALYAYVKNTPDLNLEQFSNDVRQDFIDMAENLGKTSMEFLADEMPKLKFDDLNKWHKYEKEKMIERFKKTQLEKKYIKSSKK